VREKVSVLPRNNPVSAVQEIRVASPFSWTLILFSDRDGREMFCERAFRAFAEPPSDELFLQEEPDDHPAKILRHPVEVPRGDMHEPAGLIKAAFQHDGVPVWMEPKKLPRRLVGQNHSRCDRPGGCLGIEVLNGGEDESADFGKQPPVVPEIWTQTARDREDELPVGQGQQEPLVHVLGEQQGPFLRAGGIEVEGLAAEGTEVFRSTAGIGALNAGYTLGVVPAQDELVYYLADALDAESTVNAGVLAFVLFGDTLKMALEQKLKGVDPARTVHCRAEGGKRKRCLNVHSEIQRGDRSS